MRNTTKLKHILQLYSVTLEMDDEGFFHLDMIHKRNGKSAIFVEKSYSVILRQAFSHVLKELKTTDRNS